jgi:hypothetical protein
MYVIVGMKVLGVGQGSGRRMAQSGGLRANYEYLPQDFDILTNLFNPSQPRQVGQKNSR